MLNKWEARDLPEEIIHVVNFPVLEAGAKMRVLRRGTECVWCIPLTPVTDRVPGALLDSGDVPLKSSWFQPTCNTKSSMVDKGAHQESTKKKPGEGSEEGALVDTSRAVS